jgi:hypothetical protein
MSATLTQMAFWAIFLPAAFIVVSGWSLIILIAIKRLRTPVPPAQVQAGNVSEKGHTSAPAPRADYSDVIETVTEDGIHFSPIS